MHWLFDKLLWPSWCFDLRPIAGKTRDEIYAQERQHERRTRPPTVLLRRYQLRTVVWVQKKKKIVEMQCQNKRNSVSIPIEIYVGDI